MSTYRSNRTRMEMYGRRGAMSMGRTGGFFTAPVERFDIAICGTCCAIVDPHHSDEGYSLCCNDRIEYGLEAWETLQTRIEETEQSIVTSRKRIASLASQVSKGRKAGRDIAAREVELANERAWLPRNRAELKSLKATQTKF